MCCSCSAPQWIYDLSALYDMIHARKLCVMRENHNVCLLKHMDEKYLTPCRIYVSVTGSAKKGKSSSSLSVQSSSVELFVRHPARCEYSPAFFKAEAEVVHAGASSGQQEQHQRKTCRHGKSLDATPSGHDPHPADRVQEVDFRTGPWLTTPRRSAEAAVGSPKVRFNTKLASNISGLVQPGQRQT